METVVITGMDVSYAAEVIQRGGLVAVPTETVYGLAGNGLDAGAVAKIYDVKGRPEVKPLSLLVPDLYAVDAFCDKVPWSSRKLAKAYWPGPLTIVLPCNGSVPAIVTAGGSTIGVRCPDHPKTLELLRLAGVPLAAPSANISGMRSPKSAREVLDHLDGKIDCVIDGGTCEIGVESTIVSLADEQYAILRRGALPESDIAKVLSEIYIIGITGGTGSGKTSALRALGKLGALTLDCDAIYHQLLAENTGLKSELEARFTGITENGEIDRKQLSGKVFGYPESLRDLNKITHKYVSAEIELRIGQWKAQGGKVAAVDAIALIESGRAEKCDLTIGVAAPKETRIDRIMKRDKITREHAEMRIDAQKPDSFYKEYCDYVLEGDCDTTEEFEEKCDAFFRKYI